ncbi:ArsR/SmtB family transcription factor [Candidimonas humi]|uniref:ArsR/SmtB family transcription factor n=1 Tax=Candidimonas humi TaxID=683355 RepID=A0ABV8P1B8_9BURK
MSAQGLGRGPRHDDVVEAPAAASAHSLDRTLAALADPHRRRVVDLLRERPLRAGDLAQAAQISFPAMSRHLKTLRQCGLVEEDRDEFDSRVRIYRLKAEAMGELKAWLAETDALWARQLAAFKAHLRKAGK